MKHAVVVHDWTKGILTRDSRGQVDLDNRGNSAAIARFAARYDVVVTMGWDINERVRDRLHAVATAQGKRITVLRYVGTLGFRWWDQDGGMMLVPGRDVITPSGAVLRPEWMMRDASGRPLRSALEGGRSHLMDPGSPEFQAAAVSHCLKLAEGWDGIYLDEITPIYGGARFDTSLQDPRYPIDADGHSPAYEAARRSLVRKLTRSLSGAGKRVSANIAPMFTPSGYFPGVIVRENSGLAYPFLEVFGTDWDSTALTQGKASFSSGAAAMDWLDTCESLGRAPIVNCYSNNESVLRYGLGLFLAAAGSRALFSGSCPPANDEYTLEPRWLPDYDLAAELGAASGLASGASVLRRHYAGGVVAVNTGPVAVSIDLGGYYSGPGESAESAVRMLAPGEATTLVGHRFSAAFGAVGTTRQAELIDGTWRSVGAPGPQENLWLANPGFRVDTRGWSSGRGAMLVRRQTGGPQRLPVLDVSWPQGARESFVTNSARVPCRPGDVVNVSLWIRGAECSLSMAVDFYSADGRYLAYSYGEAAVSKIWRRVWRTIEPPAGAASFALILSTWGTASRAMTVSVAGVRLERGWAGTFFDGGTKSDTTWRYAWSGVPNESVSTASVVAPVGAAAAFSSQPARPQPVKEFKKPPGPQRVQPPGS